MSGTDPRGRITRLFHFTDTRNLPDMRRLGGIFSMAELRARGVTPAAPGGNEWSIDADRRSHMDQYVHLCLANTHPMEYHAKKAGRILESYFLQIDVQVLHLPGVLFSPGVSNAADAAYYRIEDAGSMIDFEVLFGNTDWRDPVIKERRKVAKKCEVLVPSCVPLNSVWNFPNG